MGDGKYVITGADMKKKIERHAIETHDHPSKLSRDGSYRIGVSAHANCLLDHRRKCILRDGLCAINWPAERYQQRAR